MQAAAAARREEAKRAMYEKLGIPYLEVIAEMDADEMMRRAAHTLNVFPLKFAADA